jgi:phenylalanyl-tRNA synthetase beta chain
MKVSINWAQRYSNVDLSSISTDELLQKIGAQLGAVEEVIYWGPRFEHIVVARIVSCFQHPNADKLRVCMIDDGGVTPDVERNTDGLVQVVCGAPNAREGILVAWLPPGSTVPSSIEKDPFVLSARELRGEVSNGMLASAHELGISDDHDGILEINAHILGESHAKPGSPFASLYALDDVIIDCENKMFTHRPDCFGILGVAREFAGILNQKFESPTWYLTPELPDNSKSTLPLTTKNEITNKVPRFMAQVVENVEVHPSSTGVQAALSRVGSRPINNLVDLTNFYMHLTAQPTHAFDYDKVKALCDGEVTIFPRMAKDGETITLLTGKTITLTKDDIVIATDKQAIALAGVMGGSETEVDAETKNIIVECANFDMYTIRRTSMRHGLFTDAVTRFNKGQSFRQNPSVLAKIVAEVCEFAGGTAGVLVDTLSTEPVENWGLIRVETSFINARLGSDLSTVDIKQLLENVEFAVTVKDNTLEISSPFWRKDIELGEDIVEEVGRLYGFDKLSVYLPTRTTKPAPKNPIMDLKRSLRSMLSSAGANEVVTYSFVSGSLIKKAGQNVEEAYQLANALSPELEYYRLTLTPSLLQKVAPNLRAGHDEFALFEINKTHVKLHGKSEDKLPIELQMTSLVYAANDKSVGKKSGAAYYQAKAYLDFIATNLGVEFTYTPIEKDPGYEVTKPFDYTRSAMVTESKNGTFIGIIGEYTALVRRNLKLPQNTAGFEIGTEGLLECVTNASNYKPLSKYPSITQDMTFQCPQDSSYASLVQSIHKAIAHETKELDYEVTLQPIDIFQKENSSTKNVSLRLAVTHLQRTLKTDEVTSLVDAVCARVAKELGFERV